MQNNGTVDNRHKENAEPSTTLSTPKRTGSELRVFFATVLFTKLSCEKQNEIMEQIKTLF